MKVIITIIVIFTSVSMLSAQESSDAGKPIPQTREEIKRALESLKNREARLPLGEASEAEKSKGSVVNNARIRNKYLSPDLRSSSNSRERDPNMTLDNTFKVYLFWITSRVNNCHYCLGHQELKLRGAGVKDDTLGALDGEWSVFTPAEQAAFTFTHKLTHSPHLVGDADIETLKRHYTPMEALEIAFTVAGYNATNRWTDSLGIPAESHGDALNRFKNEKNTSIDFSTFLTPTSTTYRTVSSKIIPQRVALNARGDLPTMADVMRQIAAKSQQKCRFPLVESDEANWVRLLQAFPKQGVSRIELIQQAQNKGTLPPLLKAKIEWTAARHDRAIYALAQARKRMLGLGITEHVIEQFDAGQNLSAAELAVIAFTHKLTVAPQLISDNDITTLRKHYRDEQVAEIVYHITNCAFYDRITIAAGLPIDDR